MSGTTIIIGGDAGQGVESSGAGFCTALARAGLHVFTVQDNRSRIRGGHNFYTIKSSENPIVSWNEGAHLVVALTAESVHIHADKLVSGGGVIYDSEFKVDHDTLVKNGKKAYPVPLNKIATDVGGNKVMANTAALGAVAGVTRFDLKSIHSVVTENFKKKGEKIVKANIEVATAAYEYVTKNFDNDFEWKLNSKDVPARMLMNGNQAIALGALASGCNFTSAYPMTPGTSIFEWLTKKADEYGIVSKQTEDEIAAICVAIGASHVGARAIVPTSGGGFALMVEALGLAAMTETPLVIVDAQRPGPSTGFATRTEQSDLMFVLHASHGEFPRFVLAPGNVKQCYEQAARAFNLAEKYQTPVIMLTDAFLANSARTIEKAEIDFKSIEIDRGKLLTDADLDKLTEAYKRHAYSGDGISPRALPGHPNAVFKTTSDEHNEFGEIVEEADIRINMHGKRMKKQETALQDMNAPELYGPENADATLLCWGSTLTAAQAAVSQWNEAGQSKINMLHFIDLWPLPVDSVTPLLNKAAKLIGVEGNFTGQLGNLIRMHTGIEINDNILKYDGRPFSPEYIIRKIKELM